MEVPTCLTFQYLQSSTSTLSALRRIERSLNAIVLGSEEFGKTVLINRVCCKEESFRPRLTVDTVLTQQFQDNHESTFEQSHQNNLFIKLDGGPV